MHAFGRSRSILPRHRLLLIGLLLVVAAGVGSAEDRSIDTVIERPDAWQDLTRDRVTLDRSTRHTHGTPASLHLAWKKDLGDIAGKGIPKTSQVPRCWLALPEDLDLSKYTRLWFWAKIEGTHHGHLHVGFASQKTLWSRDPTFAKAINNTPLDAGEWRRYAVTFGQLPAEERKRLRWMCIASINVGFQPDEKPVMQVWLDDFTLTDKPLRRWEGWDADPTVVIVNQAGFRPLHEKIGLVDGKVAEAAFTVRRADNGEDTFSGRLEDVQSPLGSYKVADFTKLTTPGRYVVHIGELKSLPFRIGDDAYRPCLELLSDWVFNMRCGCKTELHGPCHTDDATFVTYEGKGKERKELTRRHLDLVGGWHDAGDVRTYYSYTVWMAHNALRARECGWRRDRDRDGVDDLLDSALWGMQHLPKIRNPDTGAWFFKIEDWPDYRRGNYWTDCLVGTPDDRHAMNLPEKSAADYTGEACASAGLFARRCGPGQREMADAALKAAEERWAYWFDPEKGRKPWKTKDIHVFRHGNHVAKWGQGSLQLYLATKKPVYLEFARHCADMLMGYQKRTFYRGGPQPMCGEIFSWLKPHPNRDLPEEFLADMMLELPDDPDYPRWRATLVRAAEWWMKPTRRCFRPFSLSHLEVPAKSFKEGYCGVPIDVGPKGEVRRYLVPTAWRQNLGDTAYGVQRVAQALNDVELERLVRRQVQWAIGHNPFNVSWICDFGEDCVNQFYSFSQGRMPGCVSGFGMKETGVPRCIRPYDGESYTQPGARLLRAMIAATEPATLHLFMQQGNVVNRGAEVSFRWKTNGQVVLKRIVNANGFVPSVNLDGGQEYDLECDGVVVPLEIVSGTFYDRPIDLARIVVLSAGAPKQVKANEAFDVVLTVANRGKKPAQAKVTVYAEDATTNQPEAAVAVDPGRSKAIKWPFRAGEGNRPYVITFTGKDDRSTVLDVTGEILP